MLKRMTGVRKTRPNRAGGDGTEFPLRVAKVTRVDPKKLVVDLITFTGNNDTYENVALTFPNAGARHFMGAVPEVNDLCIIDYSPAESGTSRRPYIVGWLIPGTDVAYDWITTQLTDPKDIDYTPKVRESLEGVYGRRRHKLRQMNSGNIVASSSQGSDMILSEDLLLANRRGNELLLRDSDQSLVVRSLQQFHAGSGFRIYSGMVQRDANLLPRQIFSDGIDYSHPKQLDEDGNPIPVGELEGSELEEGQLKVSEVFDNENLLMGTLDPKDILSRGLFIDEDGVLKNPIALGGSTYGGKTFYRVSKDLNNSVPDNATETFTEYRIEVSHTADGTLPVTEQTDGIDIDRLPQSQFSDDLGDFEPNTQNKSINSPMVEMVMGTVVGNDPINDPDSYGVPLVATIFDENGLYSPGINPAGPGTPVTSHIAWMVKIKNPTSNTAPAFMAVTKGGALKQYFPGVGSETFEEYYEKGKVTGIDKGSDGFSQIFNCNGAFQINSSAGAISNNVGIDFTAVGGAVNIYGGGYNLEGSASLASGQNVNLPAAQQIGIQLETPHSIFAKGGKEVRIQGSKRIFLEETNIINMTSNNSINMSTDAASMNFKTLDVTMQGNTTFTSSGTLNMQFNGNPAFSTLSAAGQDLSVPSGGIDPVISIDSMFGGKSETYKTGKVEVKVGIGGIELQSSSTEAVGKVLPEIGPGTSISLTAGMEFGANSEIEVSPIGGIVVQSSIPVVGDVQVNSNYGMLELNSKLNMQLTDLVALTLKSPLIQVKGVTLSQFGGVLTDGCKDPLTGRSFLLSGCRGVSRFRVTG